MAIVRSTSVETEVKVKVNIDPELLALAFWEMDADQQAEVFNQLSKLAPSDLFATQMESVRDSVYLERKGLAYMFVIGDNNG